MDKQPVRRPALPAVGSTLIAAMALFAGLATAVRSDAAAPQSPLAAQLLHDPHTQVLGNVRGDITVVEFFDYACPTCKATEPRVEALLKADKNVKLVAKEFPVLSPESVIASKAALAAARQGKYSVFHEALLSHRGGLDEATIFAVAQDVGLDVARLRKDMTAPEISDEIAANLKLAHAIHVPGTPTFIVGGRMLTQPASSIDFPAVVATARHGAG